MRIDPAVIRPSQTALVVVDMVRDFTDPDGLVFYPMNRQILPAVVRLVDLCHQTGTLVIFMQHRYRSGKYDRNLETMRPNCIEAVSYTHLTLPTKLEV